MLLVLSDAPSFKYLGFDGDLAHWVVSFQGPDALKQAHPKKRPLAVAEALANGLQSWNLINGHYRNLPARAVPMAPPRVVTHAVKTVQSVLPKRNPARMKKPSPLPQRPLVPDRFRAPRGEKQIFL